MTALTPTPEAQALAQSASVLLNGARVFTINSPLDFEVAGADLRAIKAKGAELDAMRKRMTAPLDESKRAIMDFFRAPTSYLSEAEALIKRSMLGYSQEVERKRREEEAIAQEIVRKEQEKLRRQADAAAAKGREERAEELRFQADMVPVPIVVSPPPKAAGISLREVWSAEIVDKMKLIKAVAEGRVPMDALQADMKFLNGAARSFKNALGYPGVRAVRTETMAARV